MIKNNWKPNDKHPLSAQWSHTHRITGNRLSFFGKAITYIDRLDSISETMLQSIKQLDLSHNALAKLDNIRQFPNIEILNLAHNHIIDGKIIYKLNKLSKLKTVLVKGNPFLKSGEGKIEAFKFLISVNTDIQILTSKVQKKLVQCISKYCQLQIKQQSLNKIQLHIQLITDFNAKVGDKCQENTYYKIIDKLIENRINQTKNECRKQVIKLILNQKNDEQFLKLESKEDLQIYFEQCMINYNEKMQEIFKQMTKKTEEKMDVFGYVKKIRKQKQIKENYSSNFARPHSLSPALRKNTKLQNKSPLNIRQFSSPNQNSNIFALTTPFKLLSNAVKYQFPSKKVAQQNFQSIYYNMLTKYNPVYQLLFSPLHSLKNKQKDLLIETLSNHLKQKSYMVYKLQKGKQQYLQVNKKCQQQQKIIQMGEQKFYEYKMVMNEKVNMLQLISNEKQQQIKELIDKLQLTKKQNSQMASRLQYLQQQLGQSKLKDIKLSHQLQKNRHEEDIIEMIQMIREKNIKQKIFNTIQDRSAALVKLKKTQNANRLKQKYDIMNFCFTFLKQQVIIKKKFTLLKQKKLKSQIAIFINIGQNIVMQSKLQKQIENKNKALLFSLMKSQNQTKKMINNFLLKQNKIKKQIAISKCFKEWKQLYELKLHCKNIQKAQALYLSNLIKRCFKNWQVYVKLPIYQQAELAVDLKTIKTKSFLVALTENYYSKVLLGQKFLNLINFLNKSKRIVYYLRFKQFSTMLTENRNGKQKRLNHNLKKKYYFQFINIAYHLKNQRKRNTTRSNQVKILRKKVLIQKLNTQEQIQKIKTNKLNRIFHKYRKLNINEELKISLKQFIIEDCHNKLGAKLFFTNLRTKINKHAKISLNFNKLKLFLNQSEQRKYLTYKNKRVFMQKLQQKQIEKKKLVQFLNKKYEKMMLKYFKQWRIQIFKKEINYLKGRIHQFGPQIEEIIKRQKTTHDEKLVLINIIENKQKTIKGVMQQLEQAEYTIKTKQQKYQKLKEYFYQNGEDVTVIGSKVQSGFSQTKLAPERDYDTFLDTEKNEYFSSFRRF